jgi:D-hydroxyproline dehydrogenase subunit gamma
MKRLVRDGRPLVSITVDGESVSARAGDPLATALALAGYLRLRASPGAGTARGAFCHMGVCQECALHVDGVLRQACLTPVSAGMTVELRGVP